MEVKGPRFRAEMIATMSSLWSLMPHMRFTQLVQFVAGKDDPFYMEDAEFYKKLSAAYNKRAGEEFQ